jgi:hypothetical protein
VAKPYFEIGRYGSVGLELVLTILIPAAIGHWLDGRYWHDSGYGVGVGFLIGCVVGFRNLVRTANGMQRDIERAEANDPDAQKWTVDEAWMHADAPDAPDVNAPSKPATTPDSKSDRTPDSDRGAHGKNGPPN